MKTPGTDLQRFRSLFILIIKRRPHPGVVDKALYPRACLTTFSYQWSIGHKTSAMRNQEIIRFLQGDLTPYDPTLLPISDFPPL